jgi:hypothetical protein
MYWSNGEPVEWLIRGVAAGAVLLLAGAFALVCVRQPSRRQRLGEFAVLSALVVAVLALFPAWSPLSLGLFAAPSAQAAATAPDSSPAVEPLRYVLIEGREGPQDSAAASEVSSSSARIGWFAAGVAIHPQTGMPPLAGRIPLSTQAQASPERTDAAHPPRAAEASGGLAWLGPLGFAYVLVAGGLLFWCALGYVGLWRLRRSGEPVPPVIAELYAELTRGWIRPPLLRLHRRVLVPISFGLFRPTILLPEAYSRLAARSALRVVLAHELTHLQRRDAWSRLLLAVSQALFFLAPWFWWLRRQVRLCQEYVADAAAARLSTSVDYAEYLVSLSSRTPRTVPAGIRAMGILGSSSDLYRRVAMLLSAKKPVEGACPRWLSLLAAAGFLGAAVFASGIGLQAQAAEPTPAAAETKSVQIVVVAEEQPGEVVRLRLVTDPQTGKITVVEEKTEKAVAPPVKAEVREGRLILIDPTTGKQIQVITIPKTSAAPPVRGTTDTQGRIILVAPQADGKGEFTYRLVAPQADGKGGFTYRLVAPQADGQVDPMIKDLEAMLARVKEMKGLAATEREKLIAQLSASIAQLKQAKLVQSRTTHALIRQATEEQIKLAADLKKVMEQIDKLPNLTPAQREAIKKQLQEAMQQLQGPPRFKIEPPPMPTPTYPVKPPVPVFPAKPATPLTYPVSPHGRLGVQVTTPSETLVSQLGLPKGQGLVISEVMADSTAAKAELQKNDILMTLDGKPVGDNPADFSKLMSAMRGGAKVDLGVVRQGKKVTVSVTLPAAAVIERQADPTLLELYRRVPAVTPQPNYFKKEDLFKQIPPDVLKQLPPDVLKQLQELTPPESGPAPVRRFYYQVEPLKNIEIEIEGLKEATPEVKKELRLEIEKLKKELPNPQEFELFLERPLSVPPDAKERQLWIERHHAVPAQSGGIRFPIAPPAVVPARP